MKEEIKLGDIVQIILGGKLTRTRYVVISDRCRNGLQAGYWVKPRGTPRGIVGSFARECIVKPVERSELKASDRSEESASDNANQESAG